MPFGQMKYVAVDFSLVKLVSNFRHTSSFLGSCSIQNMPFHPLLTALLRAWWIYLNWLYHLRDIKKLKLFFLPDGSMCRLSEFLQVKNK